MRYSFKENFPYELREYAKNTDITFHTNTSDFPLLHNHDYWEFLIVLHGKINNVINGKKILLIENTLSIIRPDDIHCLKKIQSNNFSYLNIAVRCELMKKQLELLSPQLYNKIINSNEVFFSISPNTVYEIQNMIHSYRLLPIKDIEAQELYKKGVFLTLINLVITYISEGKNFPAWFAEIREIFERPQNLKLNINDICNMTHYSRMQLNRLFNMHFNQSPKKYLINIKMNYACRYLLSSDETVANIALNTGYTSIGHFNKTFKNKFDLLPGEYRKKYRSGLNKNK